jgi:tetratricopeptide (TPR) repeat protein
VQSRLHMSHLFLELGKLHDAAEYLETAERANAHYGDADLGARIMGYRGLLTHLAGNLAEAETIYRTALEQLRKVSRHNLRAESIFTRYLADLMLGKGALKDAEALVRVALSRADEGNFPDLQAYARKSLAHVWRDRKEFSRAQGEYNAAMNMARNFGIKRLQADLYSERARLALDVGDWETARRRSIESLMLANELNLGLRRTHGLVVLGLATLASGDTHLAGHYFRHARALAREQGYHLRGREAEIYLQKIGEMES